MPCCASACGFMLSPRAVCMALCIVVTVRREDTDPHSVGVSLSLVMWTGTVDAQSGIPSPCLKDSFGSCTRLVRVLTLLRGQQPGTLVTTFYPDASVSHYMFVARDADSCGVSKVMLPHPGASSPGAGPNIMDQPRSLPYAGPMPSLFVHGRHVCDPVLHLYVPLHEHPRAQPCGSCWLPLCFLLSRHRCGLTVCC
jgi:hypothetical protein